MPDDDDEHDEDEDDDDAGCVYTLYRVKELTKEAAKRANSSVSPASHQAPRVLQSFETAPDIVPRQTLKQPRTKPSLFHPSNIQLSSTPMKDVRARTAADTGGLLLDGENDLPISGHHLSSGSSTNHDRRIDRISPIHDSSGLEVDLAAEFDVDSSGKEVKVVEDRWKPAMNGANKSELELSGGKLQDDGQDVDVAEERDEALVSGRRSPCSCRSLNSSLVSIPPPPQPECGGSFTSSYTPLGGFPSVPRLPSSGKDSQQLFAQTKARMENARTNIQHFLHTDKTRTSDVSSGSHRTLIHHEDRLVNSLTAGAHDVSGGKPESSSVDKLFGKVQLLTSSAESETVRLEKGMYPPDDVVVMETASSRCHNVSDEHGQQTAVNCENSGRSWAEILEHSSGSYHCSGQCVPAAVLPDLSWNEDSEVTSHTLDLLKAKVAALKRRQEQLERDHFIVIQTDPEAHRTPPDTSTTKQNDFLTSVSRPGNSRSSSSGVSMSERSDEVAEGVKAGENSLQSTRNLFRRTTSAARSLVVQFTDVVDNHKPATVEATSDEDVICQPSGSDCICDSHTTTQNHHHLLHPPHPLGSSSSNHLQEEVKSTASTGTFDGSAGGVLETKVDARTSFVDSSGRVVSSAHAPGVTIASEPDNHHTCVSHDSLLPTSLTLNTRSAKQNMRPSSVQPGSNADFMMSTGNTRHTMEVPGVVSSTDVVSGCNGLSRLPVPDGCLKVSDGSEAGGMLVAHHSDSSQQSMSLNNCTKSSPVTVDDSSQSADCRSVESVTACVNDNAATPLQQSTCSTLPAMDQYHSDVEHFVGVSSTSVTLPAAAHSRDMIQRPSARQLSQSVEQVFTYLLLTRLFIRSTL